MSQTITPVQSTEQCPGVNITFTVTIAANSIQSIQSKALNVNPTVVQQPFNITTNGANKTFNFVGKFADYNNKQTFTVYYTNTSGVAATWDATFIKIKSLLTANSFSQIYPTPTSIISAPCQITTHNISFSNVQYGNIFESPPIGYGTISTFEYLLPTGWILNGVTSNGSNWIPGSNNVTVTSNLANGGSIQIRAVNPCDPALAKGQIASIPVSRPKPVISFSGNQTVCTGNTYISSNIPSWVTTYNWQLNPSTLGTISGTNPVTVTKTNTGFGELTLSIGAPGCPTYNYNTIEWLPGISGLIFGSPTPTYYDIYGYDPNDGSRFGRLTMTVSSYGAGTSYKWYVDNVLTKTTTGPTWGYFPEQCDIPIEMSCIVQNACGQTPPVGEVIFYPCINNYIVTNEPNNNTISIESTSAKRNINEIKIYDNMGNLKMTKRYTGQNKKITVDLQVLPTNYYVLVVYDGSVYKSFKILK